MKATFSRPLSKCLPIHLRLCPTLASFFYSIQCSHIPFSFYSRLRARSRAGDYSSLLSLFVHISREQALKPDRPTYLLLLKASATLPSHPLGLSLHGHILKSGFQDDILVATALVDMLSKCRDVEGARKLFDQIHERDVGAWNAMLSSYARNGYADAALSLFSWMGCCGTKPNSLTLSILLQVRCGFGDERLGRSIHAYAVRQHELAGSFLGNSLIVYYNKAGEFHISKRIFDRMPRRDIVSWNAMISGYMQSGNGWRALEMFHLLREQGLCPDLVTLETALQACAQIGKDAFHDGQLIHALLVKMGIAMDVYAENTLLLMYCKCGKVESGQSLFDKMQERNVVSWNILVNGYSQIKCPEKVLALIRCMRFIELELNSQLLVSALQAIRLLGGCIKHVICLHCLIIVMGFDSDIFVSSSLIAAYGDCSELEFAHRILDCVVSERSDATVCWNTMLSLYAHHGYFSEAVELLGCMLNKACMLDAVTLVSTLSVCTQQLNLSLGKAIHGYVIRNKFESDVFVGTSLIDMYAKCGLLNAACWLFSRMPCRNIVTWNTMIHVCHENGFPRASLQLFHLMQQHDGPILDATTVVGVIEAIAQRGYDSERNYIHKFAIETGLSSDEFIANSLISMHARLGDVDKASAVFNSASKVGTATWNTMIAEYSCRGLVDKAISVFHAMKLNNVAPDSITLLCVLRVSASLGSLNCIMWLHAIIMKAGYESDLFVGTSLLDVYAKCGDLSLARLIFDNMNSKTEVSWNSMIQGYGMHGHAGEVGKLFSQMQQSGLNPNTVTFLILISACSHARDVEKGRHYFDLMTCAYSFLTRREHYAAYIDLLSRGRLIKEAYEALEKMPINPGADAWGALLGACRIHGNLEVGLAAAKKLFELDPLHCGYHVLLSNMCMEAGRWTDASEIRRKVDKMGLKKVLGWSKIQK
ncbi:pentatricopeptide repeat-containing protein At1g11290, chloroplastic-like isoform X2 [Phoenix dactylifera]|uniref:Pentatricopeptide repeat-containing protein At1g11290, chloroplastic-like isoform X2 n=1 Tax=Phoenix dactylifera TaxID=42345 RepID=A0A8B8J4Q4_PHODC|nr:pentatricopeptide repeat-containing protein At1g11290, chloroplastic-like isoform X2 [Phoenix dactylifera]